MSRSVREGWRVEQDRLVRETDPDQEAPDSLPETTIGSVLDEFLADPSWLRLRPQEERQ